MKSRKARYLYLTSYWSPTVSNSQIINWLKLIEEYGIVTDLIVLTGVRIFFQSGKNLKKELNAAEKSIRGTIYHRIVIKSRTLFGQFLIFSNIFFILFKDICFRNPILLKTRSFSHISACKMLKTVYPKLIILFDSRGAVAEEFLLSHGEGSPAPQILSEYRRLMQEEIDFLKLSDCVFCVSEKLKKYHLRSMDPGDENKFMVVPGCADRNIFFWNPEGRKKIRKQLGLDEKFVFVYSGRLNKAWQVPDLIFSLYKKISDKKKDAVLLCLTPDVKIVDNYIKKYNIDDCKILKKFATSSSLGNFLCAADSALLLRDDSPTNNVASPTKFAEYVMCGLPVIISENVGDFSEFVKKYKIGLVVNNKNKYLDEQCIRNIIEYSWNREYIADIGKSSFSKQIHLGNIVDRYRDLSVL